MAHIKEKWGRDKVFPVRPMNDIEEGTWFTHNLESKGIPEVWYSSSQQDLLDLLKLARAILHSWVLKVSCMPIAWKEGCPLPYFPPPRVWPSHSRNWPKTNKDREIKYGFEFYLYIFLESVNQGIAKRANMSPVFCTIATEKIWRSFWCFVFITNSMDPRDL